MGPLQGIRVIEFAGIGPTPFAGMLLADLGATVLRIDQPPGGPADEANIVLDPRFNLLHRGRRSVVVNLKAAPGRDLVLDLARHADIVFEGFRPGVMERLGLGPEAFRGINSRIVYGRMTGWGQSGPLAGAAGHDLNYIALAGALNSIGPGDRAPVPPLNLIGDFGGGGMLLVVGLLAACLEARQSGRGQVVDAAMMDGAALLMTMFFGLRAAGLWSRARGQNLLDGGAPWYASYAAADGKFVSIAAIEPRFYRELIRLMGLGKATLPAQYDITGWPTLRATFTEVFASRTRAEWCRILEGTDACFAPVLELDELRTHPHVAARETIIVQEGIAQPAPAPRFSRTPARLRIGPGDDGDTSCTLEEWGMPLQQIAKLSDTGVVRECCATHRPLQTKARCHPTGAYDGAADASRGR